MHERFLGVVVLFGMVAACGGGRGGGTTTAAPTTSAPAETTDDVTFEPVEAGCTPLGLLVLQQSAASPSVKIHDAMGRAQAAYDAAAAAHERGAYLEAARQFLACAVAYREVPDGHWQRGTASENAASCYKNASYAYASGGRFAAEGRAALERAADEDPRHAEILRAVLASPPHDCTR